LRSTSLPNKQEGHMAKEAIFGKDRCTMFEMNKHLSKHLS
jgi:hypothetical protein